MKKPLIFIFLLFIITLYSHEVSFIYSTLDEEPNAYSEHKGWQLNFAALRWGNNDFSDYAVSVLLTQYGAMIRTDLDLVWLRFKLLKNSEIRIGKQYCDFGYVAGTSSC